MLTLAEPLRVGSFTVLRDVLFRDGVRAYTTDFYAIPDTPRLARDDAGGPAFRFLWYRALDDSGDAGAAAEARAGGMLTAIVEIGPSDEERAALCDGIREALGLDAGAPIRILSLPAVSGEVALSFAGEEDASLGAAEAVSEGGELVAHAGGNGPARLLGAERAAFAMELTKDGAALFAAALDEGKDLLRVRYDLAYEHRLDAVELRVFCDARRAHDTAAARRAAGPLDATSLRERLEEQQIAGVAIASETPVPPLQQEALTALGRQLLEAALGRALIDEGGDVRPYDTSFELTLNHTFTQSFPATAHAIVEGPLDLALSPEERAARVLEVDVTDASRPLAVTVVCPIDFADGLIGAVHAFFTYRGTAADGAAFTRADDFVLSEGAAERVFRADATASERRYRYRLSVHYKDGSITEIAEREDDATVLVLNVADLGVLDVEIALGDVPLAAVRSAVVDLEHPPRGLTHRAILDGAAPTARWQAVIGADADRLGSAEAGAAGAAPYRFRVAWITADGRRIEEPFRDATARRLFLDAPPGLGETATVHAVSAGDFEGVTQIVLALRTGPEPSAEQTELTFTAAGQTQLWRPRAPGSGPLRYQARRMIVYADGTVRALDWTDEDARVLVVRDLLRFTVRIVARLLDLGQDSAAYALALLALEHEDEDPSLRARGALVLRDRGAEATWTFRLAAPERHGYRYQLTLVPREGARRVTLWREAEAEILVLTPPENEA